jgi:hypothetical protein
MAHISSVSVCSMMGDTKAGDVFHINAFYDMQAHMPMKTNDGGLSDVMGISILYISVPNDIKGNGGEGKIKYVEQNLS